MKNLSLNVILLLTTCLFIFSSCKDDDNEDPTPEPLTLETASNIVADPIQIDPTTGMPMGTTGKFTLFSLRENKIIANTDSASTKWDIGFRGSTIIVNGGAIRTGQGGAFIFDGLFEELQEIPENQTFKQDNSETDLAITTGSGKGWYNYDPTTHVISPIAGKILVIRTADEKYAKVEIVSYYKDAPADPTTAPMEDSRHYTLRFVVQKDGSKKF
ncbi:HmuY family protein [Bernardetia sp. ABR2-2B]|uniref:HmuY family protein n=1 Tax=Bernardetia sp. ABR2-2B TaxID=3127472 RepID=UPI0030CD53D3